MAFIRSYLAPAIRIKVQKTARRFVGCADFADFAVFAVFAVFVLVAVVIECFFYVYARVRVGALCKLLRGACCHYSATAVATLGAEVDYIVRRFCISRVSY